MRRTMTCKQPQPARFAKERYQLRDEGITGDAIGFWTNHVESFAFTREDLVKSFLDGDARCLRHVATREPNPIDGAQRRAIPRGDHERRYVTFDHGVARKKCRGPHPRKGSDRHVSGRHHPVPDPYVTPEQRPVRQRHPIPERRIMGNVRAGHQQAPAADPRHRTPFDGTAMHGYMLPEYVVVADLQVCRLPVVVAMLRIPAQDRERVHDIARSQPHRAEHRDVRQQPRAGADLYACADDAKRPDCDVVMQRCTRIDDGGGVNRGHQGARSTMVASSSP